MTENFGRVSEVAAIGETSTSWGGDCKYQSVGYKFKACSCQATTTTTVPMPIFEILSWLGIPIRCA